MHLERLAAGFLICPSIALLLSALTGCEAKKAIRSASAPVVYGVDDRADVYDSTSSLYGDIARGSVVAMVPTGQGRLIDGGDGTFTPDPFTLAELIALLANASPYDELIDGQTLCPDERFAAQPTIASCSGTLIDDDLVLTAGHCTDGMSCPAAQFVFDYFYRADGLLETIDQDDVYGCAEVVVSRLDPDDSGQDYAVIRLDRPVVGRTPAPVDVGFGVSTGDPLLVVGFPSGLPAKLDDGGFVVDDRAAVRDFFTATTDTFGGSSGSGVFDAGGTLIGVLVRGEADYVSKATCIGVNVIELGTDFSGGEDVTYAANAIEALCAVLPKGESSLCDDLPASDGRQTGGDCTTRPGASSPAGLATLLVVAGALVVRRRRRKLDPREP